MLFTVVILNFMSIDILNVTNNVENGIIMPNLQNVIQNYQIYQIAVKIKIAALGGHLEFRLYFCSFGAIFLLDIIQHGIFHTSKSQYKDLYHLHNHLRDHLFVKVNPEVNDPVKTQYLQPPS